MSDIFRDWSFGGQLRELRIKRKLTLRAMSKAVKMDAGNYSKLECSLLNPPDTRAGIDKFCLILKPSPTEREMLIRAAFNFHLGKLKRKLDE